MEGVVDVVTKLSGDEFLSRYWQRHPLVLRGAFDDVCGIVDGDDLAGLACEQEVESRIVRGAGIDGPWRCQNGPFVDFDYAALGRADWTLLVQGVDQWIDDVRALMTRFDFLPAWRLEDIMASFAPTGGGVGPHFDYYDVFLIQASGRRRWELGAQCGDDATLQNNADLRLLQDFSAESSHDLEPGDGIYIPAGRAHWGRSLSSDCVTLSVGFRAPSDREILSEAFELLSGQMTDARRYRDTESAIDADPYRINAAAESYAQTVLDRLDPGHMRAALSEAFGRLVTDTRYGSYLGDMPEPDPDALAARIAEQGRVTVTARPHCRMAYSDSRLFVNGSAFDADVRFARNLCHGVIEAPATASEIDTLIELLRDDMIGLD